MRRRTKIRRALLVVAALALAAMVVVIGLLSPPVWRLAQIPLSVTRWERQQGKVERCVGPQQAGWLSLERVSRHSIDAIVTAEDARFFQHHGIDLREIAISAWQNFQQGRMVRGASTITQQLVKLLFLDSDKTLLRKLREASGALVLEMLQDKQTILEWYINIVDFGSGVYGIADAAQYYFATAPELLTIPQSILLASVIPSPNRRSLSLRQKYLSPAGQQRYLAILSRMYRGGYVNAAQCRLALLTGDFGSPLRDPPVAFCGSSN